MPSRFNAPPLDHNTETKVEAFLSNNQEQLSSNKVIICLCLFVCIMALWVTVFILWEFAIHGGPLSTSSYLTFAIDSVLGLMLYNALRVFRSLC